MAIDLFLYSSLTPEKSQEIMKFVVKDNEEVFDENFIVYAPKDLRNSSEYYDLVSLDIALEYGLSAACTFMISLNNKSAAHLVPVVLEVVKSAFGKNNIVITSDGGTLR